LTVNDQYHNIVSSGNARLVVFGVLKNYKSLLTLRRLRKSTSAMQPLTCFWTSFIDTLLWEIVWNIYKHTLLALLRVSGNNETVPGLRRGGGIWNITEDIERWCLEHFSLALLSTTL